MEPTTTTEAGNTGSIVEKAKLQYAEQARKMEQAKKNLETALGVAKRPAEIRKDIERPAAAPRVTAPPVIEEPELPDEPEVPIERTYTFDQIQILMCCETMHNVMESMNPSSLPYIRLHQARLTLLYLGGLPEFLPREEDTQQQVQGGSAGAVEYAGGAEGEGEGFLYEEDRIPDVAGIDQQPPDKDLEDISAKLMAFSDKVVTQKKEEPKETGLKRFLPHFGKKPEEREVSPSHQSISQG